MISARIDAILGAAQTEVEQQTAAHLNPKMVEALGLMGFKRQFVRGDGCTLFDADGNGYTDMLAGYGSVPLGHHAPEVWQAIDAVRGAKTPSFVLMAPEALPAALARELADRLPAPLEVSFFGSSGSEAVDGALKLARAVTHRDAFVYAEGGYHGSTFGALSVTSDGRKKKFGTLLEASEVPFGDLGALEVRLRRRDVAAVVLEPMQAEGGVRPPPPNYLAQTKRLCARYGTLLVLDEVQTGLARTGPMFALEDEGVVPDVLVLAKALSGGAMPIGAYVTSKKLWAAAYGSLADHELHCATYRGGPLACAAALATLWALDELDAPAMVRRKGAHLEAGLRALAAKHASIHTVRGRGLLWGIELRVPLPELAKALVAQQLVIGLLEAGYVTQVCTLDPAVVRVEPPLTISRAQIDGFLAAMERVLATRIRSVPRTLGRAAWDLARTALRPKS